MKISPATPEDVPRLVQLVNGAYRGAGAKQGWTTEADLLDGIRTDERSLNEMMAAPGAVILQCCNDAGELTGCVHLKKQEQDVYLGMLTVRPGLQTAGIGSQLLVAAEDWARREGGSWLRITVISVRHELIAWYERRGFRSTGETEPFPTDPRFGIPRRPLEFIHMQKQL